MPYRLTFVIICLCVSAPGHALQDPTRPPASVSAPVVVKEAQNHALASVVIGPRRRVAVIDGVPRTEGETFDGIRLGRIHPDRVELVAQGRVQVVYLNALPNIRDSQ